MVSQRTSELRVKKQFLIFGALIGSIFGTNPMLTKICPLLIISSAHFSSNTELKTIINQAVVGCAGIVFHTLAKHPPRLWGLYNRLQLVQRARHSKTSNPTAAGGFLSTGWGYRKRPGPGSRRPGGARQAWSASRDPPPRSEPSPPPPCEEERDTETPVVRAESPGLIRSPPSHTA